MKFPQTTTQNWPEGLPPDRYYAVLDALDAHAINHDAPYHRRFTTNAEARQGKPVTILLSAYGEDDEPWRLYRLHAFAAALTEHVPAWQIASIHDRKGCLSITWRLWPISENGGVSDEEIKRREDRAEATWWRFDNGQPVEHLGRTMQ